MLVPQIQWGLDIPGWVGVSPPLPPAAARQGWIPS